MNNTNPTTKLSSEVVITITMDFIIKLLKSKDLATKNAFNAILIIVDRLTKYLYIIAFKETYIAE